MEENRDGIVREEKVMSVGDWIRTFLLLIIPVVNVAMLIIWGFGGETPQNKANFAKAALIWTAIGVVLGCIFGVIAALVIMKMKIYGTL